MIGDVADAAIVAAAASAAIVIIVADVGHRVGVIGLAEFQVGHLAALLVVA